MSNFENNKILAAVLCAGITIMLTGFVADQVFHDQKLEKDAVEIEGAPVDTGHGGEAKPKLPQPIMSMIASADKAKGAKLSKACAACHSFDKGGPIKQGPNLWGILNEPVGAQPGFSYSDALREHGGAWDYNTLNGFLWKPKKYIAGTKMNFAGLKKPFDRAALIAWLREQSDTLVQLPTEQEITAEALAFAPPPADTHEDVATEIQDKLEETGEKVLDAVKDGIKESTDGHYNE